MSKGSSGKYYQKKQERLRKRARESYQDLPEKKKGKSKKMVANDIKFFLNIKNKCCLSMKISIIICGEKNTSHIKSD